MKPASILPSLCVAVLLTQAALPSIAADLIVEENGLAPNYASIQAAILAASPGDRIFVKNRPGRWIGEVNINKAVSILAFDSNGLFEVSGSWTISAINGQQANFPASHRAIRIVGMNNSGGGVATSGNNTTGTPVLVDIHGCQLTASIDLSHLGFEARISGNLLTGGSIAARAAHVLGNQLELGHIIVAPGADTSSLGDTLYIAGNRLVSSGGSPGLGYIYFFGNKHYFHIANNWVFSSNAVIMQIFDARSGPETSVVVNNSFRASLSTAASRLVEIGTSSAARVLFSNNLFKANGSAGIGSGVYVTGFSQPLLELTYNVYGDLGFFQTGGTTGGQVGNVQAAAGTLLPDNITGACTHTLCIDGGNPAADFTDHNGTRNDVGVTGGSFNPSNFWPLQTGSARVFLVKTPRVVLPGATIQAEAVAVDR